MKILITGGYGFIGQNLAEKYNAMDCDVELYTKGKNIVDIDREVRDCDYIFHCASTVHNYHMLDEYYRISLTAHHWHLFPWLFSGKYHIFAKPI